MLETKTDCRQNESEKRHRYDSLREKKMKNVQKNELNESEQYRLKFKLKFTTKHSAKEKFMMVMIMN